MTHETRKVPAAATRCVLGPFELGDNGDGSKTAPFRMVARSGDSIDHWYWGKVVHDLSGMQRHKERLPIDYIHDDAEVIGYANHFDITNGDLEVSGALVPFKDSDRATEIIHKAKAGVPYEASINFGGDGLKVEEYKPGESVNVNGREFAGPVTVIRSWPLRGIAVCPYGADCNTSTSFTQDTEIEVQIMAHDELAEVAEASEVATVEDATDLDTSAEIVEEVAVVDAEPVAEVQAVAELAKTGQDFLSTFGERGAVWFAEGKTWEEAQSLYQQSLVSRVAELESKLAAVSANGEQSPVSFSSSEQPQKKGLAGKLKFASQPMNKE